MFGPKNPGLLYGVISWEQKSLAKDARNCEESSRYKSHQDARKTVC
jgi:hypothetical protein